MICPWIPLIHTQSTLNWQPVNSLFTLIPMAQLQKLIKSWPRCWSRQYRSSVNQGSFEGSNNWDLTEDAFNAHDPDIHHNYYKPGLHDQIITKHDLTLWERSYPSLMMLQSLQLIAASDSVKHKRYTCSCTFYQIISLLFSRLKYQLS